MAFTLAPVSSHHSALPYEPLSEEELLKFYKDVDKDNDGFITFSELEHKLEQVHQEIAPEPRRHNLHHPERRRLGGRTHDGEDPEKAGDPEHDGLHAFLCSLLPDCGAEIPKDQFIDCVRQWQIPSQHQASSEKQDAKDSAYEQKLPIGRRIKAHWSVEGPTILFMCLVVGLMIAFGVWQLVKYLNSPNVRAAFGWGVVMAKMSAGVLYPTLFFTILSMSRWFATFARRWYYVSRFINWDLSKDFHIWMACVALFFASLHAIGHLTGSFLYGSRPAQQDGVAALLGPEAVPRPYIAYVRSLPGWSGITALGLFWTIAILSEPHVRSWSYQLFQLGHLLMFPMIGLLCAHGTLQLLQYTMLGYWLAFPTLLVIFERVYRNIRGFIRVPAKLQVLDEDTVAVTCRHPRGKRWRYAAGQYILLQVPSVSLFQWHPFTISICMDELLTVHIKTDGDWTEALRKLPTDTEIRVGVDGPFGAPAQRFYDFDRSLIIGAGVGITPFSAILNDLEQQLRGKEDPWARQSSVFSRRASEAPASGTPSISSPPERSSSEEEAILPAEEHAKMKEKQDFSALRPHPLRRVDFHWMVRDKNYILWFSDLLNRAHDMSLRYRTPPEVPDPLELNIMTHITMKRKNISTHVFRYLLDRYRTPSAPYSALTGLKTRSEFGRPDLEAILEDFHSDMKKQNWTGGKVGVFFCGSPKIGCVLSDTCRVLTARARQDGSYIRYVFMMEVFG